ncbi:MAG: hypothetical protein HRU18_03580 [Pseudoalteromonas sp.]|uniref:hypothetical protein n=1 Tax=Pseudoalteromonas sp. TaxID=53249 RepID=UPI001DEEF323|nr:hypothetical protein [Pseudoalteromonas sp.]NRA77267.1 hypothetical protein [Pseudoalteromonas sp.]
MNLINKDKIVPRVGFPDILAPDEEKNTDEYGLKVAQAIQAEWFFRSNSGVCGYQDKRDEYHRLRLYARGEQDTKVYKDLLNIDDESYSNYDLSPIQVIPKFLKLIVNQMSERLFDVKAEATDKYSTDLKESHKSYLEGLMLSKKFIDKAKSEFNIDLAPDNFEEFPQNEEELNLHMALKYKPAIEIATEEAIKYTLDLNDYDEVQSRVIEDVATIGIGIERHSTDPNKGIVIEYVDPANMVYSYPVHRNFKGVHYYGEVNTITINELKRLSGGQLTKDQLKEVANSSNDWARYQGNTNEHFTYREDDLDSMMVDIMRFTFKSTNTISYKKKHLKNGGYKMIEKESTFSKKNKDYKGFDVVKKTIDVWYEGILVLGSQYIINYGLCENMIRPEGYLNRTVPSYIAYAPELYQNRTRSLVQRIIPYVDQMQQIHIKLQQLIAKARPNGIYIDVAGLNEINMGDGSFLTPIELIKIYNETGNVLGASTTEEGDFNYGKEPIRELNNGIVRGIPELINTYNHYLNMLRDAIGMPQGADASTPHPKMAVGVQQNLALSSNTATRHILDSMLNISERLGEGLSLRLKDIFKYSDLKGAYMNAIGKVNIKVLESLKNFHLHDMGILIELKPDAEEKNFLEQNIQQGLQQQLITVDDAIDIRAIGNTKLANEVLKVRRARREKEKRNHEKELAKIQQEGQVMAAQKSAEARQMEIQAKAQADLQVIQAETQKGLTMIEAEKQAKSILMQQEFDYNMMLKGIESEAAMMKDKYKEDRKDDRVSLQSKQTAKLDEAKRYNLPAPSSFESSEDNISGGIDMGDIGPK